MKNIAIFLLCAACLAMTACRKPADNVQERITEEITTTITEATETEKVSEMTTTAPTETTIAITTKPTADTELIDLYTKFLTEKLEKDDYFYALGKDTFDMGLCSIIAFCDINFDGTPELFAGQHDTRGHGNYSVYSKKGILADHVSCGICNMLISAEDSCYSRWGILAEQSSHWLKFSEGTPEISVNGVFEDENSKFNVTVNLNNKENSYNDLTYTEVDNIFKREFGVTYTKLKNTPDNYVKCSLGHLEVPDPENYTEEDIYDCLLGLLQEYENQEQE